MKRHGLVGPYLASGQWNSNSQSLAVLMLCLGAWMYMCVILLYRNRSDGHCWSNCSCCFTHSSWYVSDGVGLFHRVFGLLLLSTSPPCSWMENDSLCLDLFLVQVFVCILVSCQPWVACSFARSVCLVVVCKSMHWCYLIKYVDCDMFCTWQLFPAVDVSFHPLCSSALHPHYYASIVATGGSAAFPGLQKRLWVNSVLQLFTAFGAASMNSYILLWSNLSSVPVSFDWYMCKYSAEEYWLVYSQFCTCIRTSCPAHVFLLFAKTSCINFMLVWCTHKSVLLSGSSTTEQYNKFGLHPWNCFVMQVGVLVYSGIVCSHCGWRNCCWLCLTACGMLSLSYRVFTPVTEQPVAWTYCFTVAAVEMCGTRLYTQA